MEEAQQTKAKAITTFYEEMRKVERWNDGKDFENVLYMIVDELGGEDLVTRVAQTFGDWKWHQ